MPADDRDSAQLPTLVKRDNVELVALVSRRPIILYR